jgi:nucleotide-binding universal stress UspA family protein
MSVDTDPRPRQRAAARTIVGVDGTPESAAALRWALSAVHHAAADVRAVSAWLPTTLTLGPGATPAVAGVPPLLEDSERAARRVLVETVVQACRATGVPVEEVDAQVIAGDPADVLLAESIDADLLVLGNARRGALAAAMTSSVGYRCAHHAGCPVVLVPAVEA